MKILLQTFLCLCLLSSLPACDESLPPRDDPSMVLKGSTEASYVITTQENLVRLRFKVVNTYDEVIEGTSSIGGVLTLSLVRDPSVTRTFQLNETQIQFARDYTVATKYLRIHPGDSVVLSADFDFIDDSGRVLREYFPYINDTRCTGRFVSYRETFLVRGELEMFPRVAVVVADPLLYELCHVTVYVAPNVCVPITNSTSACLD